MNDEPQTLTSTEAAALILSDGKTKNPYMAGILSEEKGKEFDFDAMTRAKLQSMMGFDFRVKVHGNKMLVSSKDGTQLRTHARIKPGDMDSYGNVVNEELIDRMVDACLRLKLKWEALHETV